MKFDHGEGEQERPEFGSRWGKRGEKKVEKLKWKRDRFDKMINKFQEDLAEKPSLADDHSQKDTEEKPIEIGEKRPEPEEKVPEEKVPEVKEPEVI